MRYLSLALLVALPLVGCVDEESAQQLDAQGRFHDALQMIDTAGDGYVPEGSETQFEIEVDGEPGQVARADLQSYRQEVLSEASAAIEQDLDAGPASQQIAARRVLASIHGSAARHAARTAMTEWTGLSNQGATLQGLMIAIDRADARGRLYSADEGELLAQLNRDSVSTTRRISQLEKDASRTNRGIQDLTIRIQDLKAQAQAALVGDQEMRLEALTSVGLERYDLYDQAAEQKRAADSALAKAQQLQVQLEVRESEWSILSKQLKLTRESAAFLKGQIEQTRQRQRQTRQLRDNALNTKTQATQGMMGYFSQISEVYTDAVDAEMTGAAERLTEAIGLLTEAVDASRGKNQTVIKLDLLAAMVEKTYVLTSHILVSSSYGFKLAAVATQAQRVLPEQAAFFQDNAAKVKAKQVELIDASKLVIAEANELAAELSGSLSNEDPLGAIATRQAERLEGYQRQIEESQLK